MATSFATGTLNIGTGAAGSTAVVSGLSFQPVFVLFWWNGRTESTDAGGSASYLRGFGVACSASSFWAIGNRYPDGAGTSDTDVGQRNDACILEMGVNAAVGWADLQSMDSGGFTLEVIDQFTTDLRVAWAAFGGSDITNAACGVATAAGVAPVTQGIASGLGFQPTGLLVGSAGCSTGDIAAVDGNAGISIGAATSTSDEHVLAACGQDAATTGDGGNYCRAGELLAITTHSSAAGTGSPNHRAEFSSFGATSAIINWLERATSIRVYWLVWKGGNFKIFDILTQTDTTTDIVSPSLGFQPNGVVLFSGGNATVAADAAMVVHDEWSVGAASSTSNRHAFAATSRDGNTNMFAQTFSEFDEIYINVDPTTDAVEGLMDVKTFGTDTITFIMDDADPAQAFAWGIACGNPPAAGKPWYAYAQQ
ncbi:MAG TPA: hypothetical protein VFO31_04380 [Vicinamibacterales bacterium]|nr:hypothetical protein [Vicinamibacterales bacterium]